MQNILIFLTIILYWVGCGNEVQRTQTDTTQVSEAATITSQSSDIQITTSYSLEYIQISEIGALFVEGVALDVALSMDGDFAYLATGSEGLSVINISNPYTPKVIGNYEVIDYVNYVEVEDNIAYVSYVQESVSEYRNLYTYDIYNPYAVQFLGFYDGSYKNNHHVYETENLLYYIDQEGFKVARKSDYKVIGRYDLFDSAYAFAMQDNIAYVANGRNGLTILKVGEKSHMATLIGY